MPSISSTPLRVSTGPGRLCPFTRGATSAVEHPQPAGAPAARPPPVAATAAFCRRDARPVTPARPTSTPPVRLSVIAGARPTISGRVGQVVDGQISGGAASGAGREPTLAAVATARGARRWGRAGHGGVAVSLVGLTSALSPLISLPRPDDQGIDARLG